MASSTREINGNPTAIGTINLENYKLPSVINSIDDIIDVSICDPERKEKYKCSVRHYRKAIEICRKTVGNYTEDELELFDDEVNKFFQIWVSLHGEKGITNYIHMLGSGHILNYMTE